MDTSVRALDPFVQVKNGWIVRRLAPDCIRVEIGAIPKDKEKDKKPEKGKKTKVVQKITPGGVPD